MAFSLKKYRDKNKDRYGDASLEAVAEDLYWSHGQDKKFDSPQEFIEAHGMDKEIAQEKQGPSPVGERGPLGDIGSQIARGGARAASLIGHGMDVMDPEGGIDVVGDAGERIARQAEEAKENWQVMQPDRSERQGEDNFVWEGVKSGIQSAVPSLTPALGGAATGMAASSWIPLPGARVGGALVGSALGTLGMFGAGVYGKSKKEAMDQGMPKEKAHSYALSQAAAEGGIEMGSNVLGLLTMGVGKAASQPVKQTVKEVLSTPADQVMKKIGKNAAINEVPTEMLQEGIQAELDKKYGMGNMGWQEGAKKAIIPAITMSMLFGLGAEGINTAQRKNLQRKLNSNKEKDRISAAQEVTKNLKGQDQELSDAWAEMATEKIQNNEPINIEENFVEFAKKKRQEEQSQNYEPPQDLQQETDPKDLVTGGEETTPTEILSEEDVDAIPGEQLDRAAGEQQAGQEQQTAGETVFTDQREAQKEANQLTKEGKPHEPQQTDQGWVVRPMQKKAKAAQRKTTQELQSTKKQAAQKAPKKPEGEPVTYGPAGTAQDTFDTEEEAQAEASRRTTGSPGGQTYEHVKTDDGRWQVRPAATQEQQPKQRTQQTKRKQKKQEAKKEPRGQDLVGKHVRSGSKVGRVKEVSEDGSQATLEDGSKIPVGKAPDWQVSDQPLEGETAPAEGTEQREETQVEDTEPEGQEEAQKRLSRVQKKIDEIDTDQKITKFDEAQDAIQDEVDDIEERIRPKVNQLQEEYEQLKGKQDTESNKRKREIKKRIDALEGESQGLSEAGGERFIEKQNELRGKIETQLRERGITDENEITQRTDDIIMTATEGRYREQLGPQWSENTLQDIIDREVSQEETQEETGPQQPEQEAKTPEKPTDLPSLASAKVSRPQQTFNTAKEAQKAANQLTKQGRPHRKKETQDGYTIEPVGKEAQRQKGQPNVADTQPEMAEGETTPAAEQKEPKIATPKKTYRASVDKGETENVARQVSGHDVTIPGFEGESFFINKDQDGKTWAVADAATGLTVGEGSTKKKAAKDAQTNLSRIGKQGLEDGRAQARELGTSVEQLRREEDVQAEGETAPSAEETAPATEGAAPTTDPQQAVRDAFQEVAQGKGGRQKQSVKIADVRRKAREKGATDEQINTAIKQLNQDQEVALTAGYDPDLFSREDVEETRPFTEIGDGRYVMQRGRNWGAKTEATPTTGTEHPDEIKVQEGDRKKVRDLKEKAQSAWNDLKKDEEGSAPSGTLLAKKEDYQAKLNMLRAEVEKRGGAAPATETTTEQEPRSLEPWEMTQQEYASSVSEAGGVVDDRAYERHKNMVTQAVNENKPVPQRVLDEHPELKQGSPQSTTTVVEPDRTESPQIKEETRRVPAIFVDQEGNTQSGSVEGNLVTIPVIIENLTFVVHEDPQTPGWYSVTNVEHGIEASPVPKKDMQGAAAVTQKWARELVQQGTSPTNFLRQKKDHFLKKAQQKEEAKAAEQQEFSQGDRVVMSDRGRHGEVVSATNIRMSSAVSGETHRQYQMIQVQTDNGAILQTTSDKLQTETESPKGVVPDLEIEGRRVTPDSAMRHIEGHNERAQRMRRSAARRRKQEYKDKDNRRAQEAEEAAKELRQALQKWANQNPKAAQEADVKKYLSTETEATVQDRPPQGERIEAYASYHTTHHAKKNIPLHVVTLDRRVERDTFTQLKEKAKEHNGWYSSYNKRGAIPGFQFQTATDAANFAQLFTNPPNNLVPETQQETQTAPEGVTSEEAPQGKEGESGFGETNKIVTRSRYEEIQRRLKEKGNKLYTGMDPELLQLGAEAAVFNIEAGARSFADYSRRMINDMGEWIKPYLKTFYEGARLYPGMESYQAEMDSHADVVAFDLNQLDKESPEQIYFEDIDYNSPWWTPQEALQHLAELEQSLETERNSENSDSSVVEHYENDVDTLKGTLRRWAADNPQESAKYAEEARRLGYEDIIPQKEVRDETDTVGGYGAGEMETEQTQPGETAQGEGTTEGGRGRSGRQGDGRRNRGEGQTQGAASEQGGRDGGLSEGSTEGERNRAAGEGSSVPESRAERAGERRDYRISPETAETIGKSGIVTRARGNLEAIRTLKQIEQEQREATQEEKETLARYIGWGGMPQLFQPGPARDLSSEDKNTLSQLRKELQELLTREEYEAARQSTQNAHYTSPQVIRSIWSAMQRLGFQGGRLLEPGSGTSLFYGLMPDSTFNQTQYTGLERDSLSGRVAQALYPNSNLIVDSYEKVQLPDNFFDAAVSNVPFSSVKPYDTSGAYKDQRFPLHDFFFAKSIDKVRPGGVVGFVTSRFTMDKQDNYFRRYMSERADFLGAVRLPNNAFKQFAGTEVTTDIIFLRKKDPQNPVQGESWTEAQDYTGRDGGEMRINEYFQRNPHMMLGQMANTGSMYGPNEPTLEPTDRPLAEELAEALQSLPEGAITSRQQSMGQQADTSNLLNDTIGTAGDLKEGNLGVKDGKVVKKVQGALEEAEVPKNQQEKVKHAIDIRDKLRTLLRGQYENASEAEITEAQQELNQTYDSFVKKHGPLNKPANKKPLEHEVEAPKLLALEEYDSDTGKASKAAVFTKRTVHAPKPVESVSDSQSALTVSLNERGRVDLEHMARISSKSQDELLTELSDVLFKDPETEGWQTRDEYLSGNVKYKLGVAREAAKLDSTYEKNVNELEQVQPEDLTPSQISTKLGSPWLPTDVIEDFLTHLLNTTNIGRQGVYEKKRIEVKHDPKTANWQVFLRDNGARQSPQNQSEWGVGVPNATADKLLQALLNSNTPQITYKDPETEKKVVDQKKMEQAREKQRRIQEEFDRWLRADPDRRERMVRIYNDTYNTDVERRYDGSHLTFPGSNPQIQLRDSQRNAAWRIIQDGRALLHHVVGSGKTWTMTAASMELRRLGLAKKPMHVVPNHMVDQYAQEFQQLYPGANVLTIGSEDLTKKKRQETASRIATGDWDAVIIRESAFEKIPTSPEFQQRFIREQIDELDRVLNDLKEGNEKSDIIKKLEKTKEKKEAKLNELLDQSSKDQAVNFEELGVDFLFVDEAHGFKNLEFHTKMNVQGLGKRDNVKKTMDMLTKVRYTQGLHGQDKGVTFATGTPISNSIAEMFLMQRYLIPSEMRDRGIEHFDGWANLFGETATEWEWAIDNSGYTQRTRFRNFVNVGEMSALYRKFADVVLQEDLPDMKIPEIKGGSSEYVYAEPTDELYELHQWAQGALSAWKKDPYANPEGNPLNITGIGSRASIDMRLVDPQARDNPESKLNKAVEKVHEVWERTKKDKLTQLVWLDEGVPTGSNINLYEDIRNKLERLGVPREEVAFIHEYPTRDDQELLFKRMRNGDVRVLIGSTGKMGTGMNIQNKLIAAHHVNPTWRPADMEQRDGRIVRHGNNNPEVELYRYSTKESFDTFFWQTLETKAGFIGQILKSGRTSRMAEDVDAIQADYAQAMAVTSGDPLARDHIEAETELRRLERLKMAHDDEVYKAETEARALRNREIPRMESTIEALKEDIKRKKEVKGEAFSSIIEGKEYTDRKKANKALGKIIKEVASKGGRTTRNVGEFGGFPLSIEQESKLIGPRLVLKGEGRYETEGLGQEDDFHNKLAHRLSDISQKKISQLEGSLQKKKDDLENYERQAQKEFANQQELEDARQRYQDIMQQLEERYSDTQQEDQQQQQEDQGEGESPSYRMRGEDQRAGGLKRDTVRRTINELTRNFPQGRLPKIHTLTDETQLPEGVKKDMRKRKAWGSVEAAWYKGELYVLANQMPNRSRVERAMVHEILGHVGPEAILGDRADNFYMRIYLDNKKEARRIAQEYDLDLNKRKEQIQAGKELVARRAEAGTQDNILDRIVRAIKEALRKAGFRITVGDAEIRQLIAQGRRHMTGQQKGRIRGGRAGPAQTATYQQRAPVFYSQMERVLNDKLPNRGNPKTLREQIQGLARKNHFKQEELDWSGVQEWLNQQEGKVSKEQVLDYLQKSNIQVQETLAAEQDKELMTETLRQAAPDAHQTMLDAGYRPIIDANSELSFQESPTQTHGPFTLKEDFDLTAEQRAAVDELADQKEDIVSGEARFEEWTLAGGKGYRELRLSLPEGAVGERDYTGGHWSEPNVVAHVRYKERTDASSSNVLFLEEVQSDWIQEGRDYGFKGQRELPKKAVVQRVLPDSDFFAVFIEGKQAGSGEMTKERAIQSFLDSPDRGMSTPQPPFKSSWAQLTLKRMIREAAAQGKDKLAWTTGRTQAIRNSQLAHVNAIRYAKVDSAEGEQYMITGHDIAGEEKIDLALKPDELDKELGSELAERVRANEGKAIKVPGDAPSNLKEISGLDQEIGGAGMEGFYDKRFVNEVNRYLKKWGVKARQGSIYASDKTDAPLSKGIADYLVRQGETVYGFNAKQQEYVKVERSDQVHTDEFLGPFFREVVPEPTTVWEVPITREMADSALDAGQPLFRREPAKKVDTSGILREDVRKEMEENAGQRTDSLIQKAIDKLKELSTTYRSPIEQHLDLTQDAQLFELLRRQRDVSREASHLAWQRLTEILSPLKPYGKEGKEVFTQNLILADMIKDMEPNPHTGKPLIDPSSQELPFGFQSYEEVQEAYEKYRKLAQDNPGIQEALDRREKVITDLREKLVAAGQLPKSVLQDSRYFHHQVMEYLNVKNNGPAGAGGGSGVRTSWKGWMEARRGSTKNYNTDYAETEFEVLAQGFETAMTYHTLQEVKRLYDDKKTLRQQAKRENIENLWEKMRREDRLEWDEKKQRYKDPLIKHKQKVAVGLSNLKRMAKNGELEYSDEFAPLVRALANDAESSDLGLDNHETPPNVLNFLNYIVSTDKPGAKWAATVFKGIRERNQSIKDELDKDFLNWQEILKRDYPDHVAWSPKKGTTWTKKWAVADRVAEEVFEKGESTLGAQDMREVKQLIPGESWVIPKRIADQLDYMERDSASEGPIGQTSAKLLSWWKQWVLMNPYRAFQYNFNNLSGDFDIATAYAPEIWQKKRFFAKAAKDLVRFHKGGEWKDTQVKEEVEDAQHRSIIDTGMTVYEIEDLNEAIANQRYLRDLMGARNENVVKKAVSKYWNGTKNFTRWRENILRLATYRFFKEKWSQGHKLYGASKPYKVDQLETVEDKAAMLARELIGDYGNISEAGEYLRRRIIPFWSWMEINAPRYVALFRNLKDEGRTSRTAGLMTWKGSKLALKASALYAGVHLFNHMVHPDEEDDLQEYQRRQLHLILGRREDGTVMTIRFQGALSDALSWFGAEDLPEDLEDISEGEATIQGKVGEAAKAAPTKMVHGIRPEPKTFFETTTGRTLYPDPWSGGRPIRDKVEHVLSVFSLDSIYNQAVGKPQKGGGGWQQWFVNDLRNLFTYETDPGEAAYYNAKKMMYDFMAKEGEERPSPQPTNRGNALYYYRQALKYGDIPAAAKYKRRYFELGGNQNSLQQSVKRAHPMAGLPERLRYRFRASLSRQEEETLQRAIAWYNQTYSPGVF